MSIHTLLLGAGYTLTRLARRLPKEELVVTTRSSERWSKLRNEGFTAALVNTANESDLASLFSSYPDIETIIDGVPPLIEEQDTQYLPEKVLAGVQNVAAALNPKRVRRIFYLSTTSPFGVNDGSWVNESTPSKPQHIRARARYESELEYGALGLQLTAFRLPAIYGPGRGTYEALKGGRYPLVDGGESYSNRIHVDDLVEILYRALHCKKPLPEMLCVGDDEPARVKEVVKAYCDAFKFPFPKSITSAEAEKRGHSTLLSNQRVSNRLLRETLELKLHYPSYRSHIAELKQDKAKR